MPKWINKGERPIDVIHNGRKIRVSVGMTIEGPVNFRAYKGLELLTEDDVKKKALKTSFNLDKPRLFNAKKKTTRNLNKKVVIPNKEFPGMITIPNNPVVLQDSTDNNTQVDAARNFIRNYPTKIMPSVGICILNKDRYELIRDCVESICEKVKYPETQIFVFDTGTTDKHVLNYYKTKEKSCKFPFTVINVGMYHFSTNYNIGIKKINTDFVMIQNNDTVALNDYITPLMKVAILDKVGLSGPRMLFKDGRIQHDGQHLYDVSGTRFVNPGHVNLGQAPDRIPATREIVDGITAAGVLVKKEWFNQLNGFDQGFRDIYQDVHLCMSNQMHGKISVCDRTSLIHHYDNTSRKDLWKNQEKVLDMSRDHNHLFHKIKNQELKIKKRKSYHFSIITLINNKKQYDILLDSLRKQKTQLSFEIIAIPNFNNEYQSCAEALNVGVDVAEGQYHIYCHQDIHFESNWLDRIYQHITHMDNNNIPWGVLGMAGAARSENNVGYGVSYLANKNKNDLNFYEETKKMYGDRVVVDCLDELCLIAKSSNKLKFDEKTFNHYHWYGADICLSAKSKNLQNFAIDAACVHDSDGISNLLDESNRKIFIQQAAKLLHKWKDKQPYFRTMTSWFECPKGIAGFFVADPLKEHGVNMPPGIKVTVK